MLDLSIGNKVAWTASVCWVRSTKGRNVIWMAVELKHFARTMNCICIMSCIFCLREQQLHPLADVQQLLFSQFPASLSLLHQGPQLIQFSLQQIVASLHNCSVLFEIIVSTDSFIQMKLRVLWWKHFRNRKCTWTYLHLQLWLTLYTAF